MRPRPVLVLTAEGVHLSHLGVFLPWSEIYDVNVVRTPMRRAWRSFDVLVFRAHDRGRIKLLKPWSSALAA